jgi:hypothetical protein
MEMDSLEFKQPEGWELAVRRLQRKPASLSLLSGHSGIFPLSLLMGGATRAPFAVIDGTMRFNSYTLSRIARSIGEHPQQLLRRVHLTRSFTAFQTEAAITVKLPRFLQNTPCPLVVILGLLDTYYDDQIKLHECRESLRRVIRFLQILPRKNIHVIIADLEVAQAPAKKEELYQLIKKSVENLLTLTQENGTLRLQSIQQPVSLTGDLYGKK